MLTLANHTFSSRLLTGTGKFSNATTMKSAVSAAQSNIVTLAMKRVASNNAQDETLKGLPYFLTHRGLKMPKKPYLQPSFLMKHWVANG